MAQPTVRGYSYGASNSGTTCTVSAPTPMSVGNTLCLLIGASNNPTITMPSGWSKVGTSNTGTVRLEAWTKAVVSADIGRNIVITLSGVQAIVGVCFVINNNDWSWDGSNDVPSDPLRVAASNTTNTPNPPNVAYGYSGRANVVLADYVVGNGGSATPPGHTGFPSDMPDSNYQYSTYNSAPDGVRHGWASLERSGGTSFDPDAFGVSRSELWRAATIVFRDQRVPLADFVISEVPGFPLQRTFAVLRSPGDPAVDSYTWDFGELGSPSASGPTAAYTYTAPGAYQVKLQARNDSGSPIVTQSLVIPATGAGVGLDGQADGSSVATAASLGLVVQMAGTSDAFATNSADMGRKRPLAGRSDSGSTVQDAALTGGTTGLPVLPDMSWMYYLDLDSGDVYSQDLDGVYHKQGTIPGTGGGGGGGAPTTADYLVGTAQAGLSAEIVVGTTPGGELGGTWPSPTVDASHSGSTHAATQAAAEATASGALGTHAAAADPHTGYLQESVVSGMGVPAITLGTVASGGIATTAVRTDGTIVAFSDAVLPTPIAYSDTGLTGTNAFASRRDHRHAMVAAPSGGGSTAFVGARVRRTATQSISNTTDTIVTFPSGSSTEDFDTDAIHDGTTNTGRLTPPAGKYIVVMGCQFASGTGQRELHMEMNGATAGAGTDVAYARREAAQGGGVDAITVSAILDFNGTDFVHMYVRQNSGAALNVAAAGAATFISCTRIDGITGPTGAAGATGASGNTALGLYGVGHDGSVHLDGTVAPNVNLMTKSGSVYTLVRNTDFTDLIIDNGVTLLTAGLRLAGRGTLTCNGIIDRTGNAAVANVQGAAFSQGATGASQGGGAGQTATNNGGNGNATDTNGSAGGPGGAGGASGGGQTGGIGGSAKDDNGATVNAPTQGGLFLANAGRGTPMNAFGFINGFMGVGATASQWWGGGAGGGGGGRGVAGTSGGGGAGGGVAVVLFRTVIVGATGIIRANGGAGAAGTGANAGGGGGGGGGVVAIMCDTLTNAGTIQAVAGAFGAGAGTGLPGAVGGNGNVYVLYNV